MIIIHKVKWNEIKNKETKHNNILDLFFFLKKVNSKVDHRLICKMYN